MHRKFILLLSGDLEKANAHWGCWWAISVVFIKLDTLSNLSHCLISYYLYVSNCKSGPYMFYSLVLYKIIRNISYFIGFAASLFLLYSFLNIGIDMLLCWIIHWSLPKQTFLCSLNTQNFLAWIYNLVVFTFYYMGYQTLAEHLYRSRNLNK